MLENPFLGALAFREQDAGLFFGRDREAWELEDLAVARRAVLLYAPSGAGKTSLLEARLRPALARLPGGAVVPPTVRLGLAPQTDTAPANPLVASVLASLDLPGGDVPLLQGLKELPATATRDGRRAPCFLVFDQFEELFTATFGRPELRRGFLDQLADALAEHSWLSVVFALREDYLPQLDELRHLLPDGLRARVRLGFLEREAAREAICGPLRTLESPIELPDEVVDTLLDELSRSLAAAPGGGHQEAQGGPIEPLYLQVVCRRLAGELITGRLAFPPGLEGEALRGLLAEAGGISGTVETALAEHYREAVQQAAAASHQKEDRLRAFCARALITPQKTRNLVQGGDRETEGLPNDAVDGLVKHYLVRRENRRGLLWYELAHDRLIAPVLGARSELEARADLWDRQERSHRLLWPWRQLKNHVPFLRWRFDLLWDRVTGWLPARSPQGGPRGPEARADKPWTRIWRSCAASWSQGARWLQSRAWPHSSDLEREFLWASWWRFALRRGLVALVLMAGIGLVVFQEQVNLTFRKVWVPFLDYPLAEIEREILDPFAPPPLARGLRLALLHHDFTRSTNYRRFNPAQCEEIERSRKLLRFLLARGPALPPSPDATDAELRQRACKVAGTDPSLAELTREFAARPYRALAYTPCRPNPKVDGVRPPWTLQLRSFHDALDRRFPSDAGCPSPYDPVFRGNPAARGARPPDAAAPGAAEYGAPAQPPPPG